MTCRPSHSGGRALRRPVAALALGALGLAMACSGEPETKNAAASAPSAAKPSAAAPSTEAEPTPTAPVVPAAGAATPGSGSPGDEAALVARGKRVYMANCIACHSQDPAQAGGLGPAVLGSSRELLEARVLRAEYPEGYTPKRETRVMIALPHLENEIDALAAYLAEPAS